MQRLFYKAYFILWENWIYWKKYLLLALAIHFDEIKTPIFEATLVLESLEE